MGKFIESLDGWVWGPVLLVLLAGTGIYLSVRMGFPQFRKFGYAMKNTIGKMFSKQQAGKGEVTPFQAVTTALAATVGTGNIAGVTGAIVTGGPGAVFWMWLCALFGMCTKYSEALLAVKYRERNDKGDWVGGPMYYIKNGLGKNWKWLGFVFCIFGALAAFGIGNMTQVNSIASSVNETINVFGGHTDAASLVVFGQSVEISSIVVGAIVAVIVGLVLFGGIKRIGSVTEKLVPVMAVIYIIFSLVVIFANVKYIPAAFALIFKGAFNAEAALGGAFGIMIMTTIQKGVGRGVFSNEAGMGSAPMAHAATSETEPVRQGLYGIFEVFMDTIVICTMTSLVLLTSYCHMNSDVADLAASAAAGEQIDIEAVAEETGISNDVVADIVAAANGEVDVNAIAGRVGLDVESTAEADVKKLTAFTDVVNSAVADGDFDKIAAAENMGYYWGSSSGGANQIQRAMGSVIGGKLGSLIVAIGLSLFALSTIISWSLYGSRCFEFMFGTKYSVFYKILFLVFLLVGSSLELQDVWNLADALNGMMAFPNLVALLALSGVIIKTTKEYFSDKSRL